MQLTFLGTVSSHIEHLKIGHSSRWFFEIFWLQIFWENWYKHLPTCGATLKNVTFGQILNKIGPIYITTSCHTVSYYWSQWVDGIRQDIFPDDPKHPLYVFSFFFCRNKFLAAIKPSFSSIRSPPTTTTTTTTTTNIVKADDDLGRRPFYIFFLFHVRTAFRSVLTIIEMIRRASYVLNDLNSEMLIICLYLGRQMFFR